MRVIRIATFGLCFLASSIAAAQLPPPDPVPGQPRPGPAPGTPAPGTPPYTPPTDPTPNKPKPPKDKRKRVPSDGRAPADGRAAPADSGARDGEKIPHDL